MIYIAIANYIHRPIYTGKGESRGGFRYPKCVYLSVEIEFAGWVRVELRMKRNTNKIILEEGAYGTCLPTSKFESRPNVLISDIFFQPPDLDSKWNRAASDLGNDERKSKFLRLMGGGKVRVATVKSLI